MTTIMQMHRTAILALAFFLAQVAGTLHATVITNGDFETGDLSGWDVAGPGAVSVATDAGNHFAEMTTGFDPISGAFITTLSQDFVIPVNPAPLTFDFAFETTGADQFAFFIDALAVSLTTDLGNLFDFLVVDEIGMILDPLASVSPSSTFTSGFLLSLDVSSFAGANATIFFDLFDEDDLADSTVSVDNLQVVPEPGSIAAIISICVLGFISYNWRRRKQAA